MVSRQLHSLVGASQSIPPFTRKTIDGARHVQGTRRATAVGPPPSQEKLSRVLPGKPPAPFQGPACTRQDASRSTGTSLRDVHTARQPFRRRMRPAPPVARERFPHCLAGTAPQPSGQASTQATLPLCGISITRLTRPRTGNQPGCRRGSCVSHVLCLAGRVASRCYSAGPGPYARLFRAGIVCTIY